MALNFSVDTLVDKGGVCLNFADLMIVGALDLIVEIERFGVRMFINEHIQL